MGVRPTIDAHLSRTYGKRTPTSAYCYHDVLRTVNIGEIGEGKIVNLYAPLQASFVALDSVR